MYKKITLFSLFFAILDIFFGFYEDYNSLLFRILEPLNISLTSLGMDFLWLEGANWKLIFGVTLLIGGLSYYFSKEKETRILRFAFASLFVQHSLFFILRLYSFFTVSLQRGDWKFYLRFFFATLFVIFVLYFLYKSLLYLNKLKELDYETFVYTESTEISYFEVNNWVRLFHLIFDSFIFFIIAYQFTYFLVRLPFFNVYLMELSGKFSERALIITLTVIFRTIFYFAFEALFSATPAKFLTESRVVDYAGLKPSNSVIFKRTLLRSLPFNAASFLFRARWHDNYSETQVCREKRTGINGAWYFILIPFFAASYVSVVLWESVKERNRMYEYEEAKFEEKKADVLYSLKKIDTNSVLQFNTTGEASNTLYLKAENISNNEIEFSILELNNFDDQNQSLVEKVYPRKKDSLQRIKIKKTDLSKLIVNKNYDPNDSDVKREDFEGITNVPLLNNQYITNIFQINTPQLGINYVSKSSDILYFEIDNDGLPASIVAIDSKNKDLDGKENILPLNLPRHRSDRLAFTNKGVENYKIQIIVNDSLNNKHTYEISNVGENYATIKLVR